MRRRPFLAFQPAEALSRIVSDMVGKEQQVDESPVMLTAQVPARTVAALTEIARGHDRSRSAEIRRALELHIRLNEAEKARKETSQ